MAQDTVADEGQLREFAESERSERRLTPPLRGVLVEIATTNIIRYPWPMLRPLVEHLLGEVVHDFDSTSQVEVGPTLPLAGGETAEELQARLLQLLDGFDTEAPFTMQRLAEVLLEPRKQYTRLEKLALALEKLLLVTSTVPQTSAPSPLPQLSSLPAVNENPLTPAVPPPAKGALATTASPHTNRAAERPQFPSSGFGVAGAVLGTLTAGAASQFLPGTQAPAALTEDIDRLQDSAPGAVAANASSTPHTLDASPVPSAPGVASQAGSGVLQDGQPGAADSPAPMAIETNTPHIGQNHSLQHPPQDHAGQRTLPDAS
ncbi:hypothetical protein CVIRNUC_011229 [Coccomyxa viridis]|uniref:Uncharacterized protein n=1 Tax=Coccomyxa viridis TaxID=1274662 RepID=A0AAV1INZ7_9CHLO|nr:hypothetical protein CVIRNUC_011229 [Coccomyxa viridis]